MSLRFLTLCSLTFLTISGCSTLPKLPETPPSYSDLNYSQQSLLAQRIQQLNQQHPKLTGYHLLANPNEAIAARLSLIQNAEKTLDLQYYIWHNDQIGTLTFQALMQAADRGVKIRLLIDDNNAKPIEAILFALEQHINIDVKLFNPYRFRKYRIIDMVFDLKRINRRMHNKTLIADHQLAIIGGRNIANEYYNASEEFQFADLDILLAGQVLQDIVPSFDDFWNHQYSYPVQTIVKAHHYNLRYPQLKQQLESKQQQYIQDKDSIFLRITNTTQQFNHWLRNDLSLDWAKADFIYDSPHKAIDTASPNKHKELLPQLIKKMQPPTEELDIISPYFIPEEQTHSKFRSLENQGVNIRVLTNSIASNDVKWANAFYNNHRKELLQNGVELYEFYPHGMINRFLNNHQEITRLQSTEEIAERIGLHSKAAIIDKNQVFIGSLNLDPRSQFYNTEIGVLLDSPKLATQMKNSLNAQLQRYAWQLTLNAKQQIEWHHPNKATHTHDPQTTWWQRLSLKLFSWLPIEHMF